MGMEFLNAIGKSVLKFFGWREKEEKRALNELGKEALTGDDDNRLSRKFTRVFRKRKK